MSDLEPLVCIGCVARVDPLSDEAEGWMLVPHSVDEGDYHDDSQWKCPTCATASDEYFANRKLAEALEDEENDAKGGLAACVCAYKALQAASSSARSPSETDCHAPIVPVPHAGCCKTRRSG